MTVVDLSGKSRQLRGLVDLQKAVRGSLMRLCVHYGRDGLEGRLNTNAAGTDLLQMANGVIEQRLGQ